MTEVRAEFVDAFRNGERRLVGQSIVPDSLLAFVWYADAIDGQEEPLPGAKKCDFVAASQVSITSDVGDRLKAALIAMAQAAGLDDAALKRFTGDTYRYLSNDRVRCETDARLETVIDQARLRNRQLVIAAHSMGGIVTFASLFDNAGSINPADRIRVARLVTFGTQVGEPLILKALLGSFVEPPVAVPVNVATWRNFRNDGDLLSFPTLNKFLATNPVRVPVDVRIKTLGERHAARSYLGDSAVIGGILGPWCRAHPTAGKPRLCAAVEASYR